MPTVQLTLDIPPNTWIQEITRSYPDTDFRVLTILVGDGTGHAVVELISNQPSNILGNLQNKEDIDQLDVLSVGESRAVLQIETDETSILEPLTEAGVPLETPIYITNGTADVEFTTSQHRLSDLHSRLQNSGLTYRVDFIGYDGKHSPNNEPNLTERQSAVFAVAYELGYFELPKEATIQDVADRTDVSKSTASDILRRAIRNLVEWYGPEGDVAESESVN
ncbi:MAG: helix-turn-helix domain-containing protein [Halodesulfurarchaeum sp.]